MPRKTTKGVTRNEQDPDSIEVHVSSGNVFADVGLPNPELMLFKSNLMIELTQILRDKKLSKAKGAALLQIDERRFQELKDGYLSRFTVDQLLRFLERLGYQYQIEVKPRQGATHRSFASH